MSFAIDPVDLRIDRLTVRFGGLVAVSELTMRAEPGMITGLVGPNGAGKSTTFNACSGVVVPTDGVVCLGDTRLTGRSPAACAMAGLGRTFQRTALWDSMTTRENVALGLECRHAGLGPWRQLRAPRHERQEADAAAVAAMDRCGIAHLADVAVGEMSTGQRRLIELARAIVSRFRFLLLDEPSSGLDEVETEQFGRVISDLATSDGIGILLVEHDMALVKSVCEYTYVLDFGTLLTDGPTAAVLASDIVKAAYLGTEAA